MHTLTRKIIANPHIPNDDVITSWLRERAEYFKAKSMELMLKKDITRPDLIELIVKAFCLEETSKQDKDGNPILDALAQLNKRLKRLEEK